MKIQKRNTMEKLPFRWREQVREMLARKGVHVSLYQITDIKRGKLVDETLTVPVLKAILQVRKKYNQKKKKLSDLLAKVHQ